MTARLPCRFGERIIWVTVGYILNKTHEKKGMKSKKKRKKEDERLSGILRE